MSSLRVALEEAILANPDDTAAHMAYADYLSEQGDPRGEFIQVQFALEDPACQGERRRQLQERESALLGEHQRDWLGPLAPHILDREPSYYEQHHRQVTRARWRRGWLDEVYLFFANFEELRALKACPLAGVLSRLDLHHVYWHEAGDTDEEVLPEDNVPPGTDYSALYVLQNAAFLPHLRWLRIGEAVNFDGRGRYNNEADGIGLVELVERTPRLEELEVLAHNVDMARLFALDRLPRLRSLLVYHGVEEYPLEVLAGNPALPALERIRLHPAHGGDEGSFLPREQVVALCRTPHLPALRHLHLHGSDTGDEGCRDIVASGILRRLKTLDLRFGCITDFGARILAACPDVRNLEHLSLADNQLTEQGQSLLRGLGISVNVEGQDEVGGEEYLWTGDME